MPLRTYRAACICNRTTGMLMWANWDFDCTDEYVSRWDGQATLERDGVFIFVEVVM